MPYADKAKKRLAERGRKRVRGSRKKQKRTLRDRNRREILEPRRAAGCVDCGNKDPRVLQFDHLPELGKVAEISKLLDSTNKLKAELAKCEVVCANCHCIRTITRGQHLRSSGRKAANE